MREQTIEIPLKTGSIVTIFDDVDMDEEWGFMADTVFEDRVVQYVPQTRKLEFEKSDTTYAEFVELLDEYDSVQVVRSP